ncbi:hypothetical protein [Caballeronia sp. SEWSISQ10-4 2]|nr:hypothetical protein [Caballeronia sp. SEWSISQ10-4 2]
MDGFCVVGGAFAMCAGDVAEYGMRKTRAAGMVVHDANAPTAIR